MLFGVVKALNSYGLGALTLAWFRAGCGLVQEAIYNSRSHQYNMIVEIHNLYLILFFILTVRMCNMGKQKKKLGPDYWKWEGAI